MIARLIRRLAGKKAPRFREPSREWREAYARRLDERYAGRTV